MEGLNFTWLLHGKFQTLLAGLNLEQWIPEVSLWRAALLRNQVQILEGISQGGEMSTKRASRITRAVSLPCIHHFRMRLSVIPSLKNRGNWPPHEWQLDYVVIICLKLHTAKIGLKFSWYWRNYSSPSHKNWETSFNCPKLAYLSTYPETTESLQSLHSGTCFDISRSAKSAFAPKFKEALHVTKLIQKLTPNSLA